ncbi:VOC family protein [Ideonella livida]|uniref:VOC family protein n=1 Tax=Ideonella livida TaxID=2707176 RepID=A0A7C9PH92_9BURK|nr:VOC family protein [Ideonella livida]NDY91331.1 VOC family protein [Ideonella livida]
MNNAVGWFELYVQDMPRAKAFYEAVFAVTLTPLQADGLEMWAFPMDDQATGASGALVQMPGCPSGGGGTIVYFSCEDCAVQEARAAAAGGTVQRGKFSIGPYGFIALVSDTEGNVIGLHSGPTAG